MNEKNVVSGLRLAILKALADPVRLEIIEFLKSGEKCVCEIAPVIGKAQSTVSKHLDILYHAGILDRRIDGRRTLYRIKDEQIFKLLEALDKFIANQLASVAKAFETLKGTE
ncbi:MAG: ArsR family transcriptional regulator [Candidatus Methanomethylicota archaeon]|uniref:ArsR family transcriptional regulator n=1 Tax=Thermoproteota archaeon TaxID=2056631 RepID=A0A497END1_9CREN|nr:MAG: ArsR family transcriptional regulator [Candidatus Verstraetearchaeota archaeon]RLE52309.1 MAG: ArsR family transcriptional regulator [Candidatus Verstraetearchaeota archaeon]